VTAKVNGRWLLAALSLLMVCCGARSELEAPIWCGNGVLEESEACDDGNTIDHDACSNACAVRTCGNNVIDRGEQCDNGADNEDRPALQLTHGSLKQPVMPVDRRMDVTRFYDYASESSHTGFERVNQCAIFLYRDMTTGRLGFITHSGIDEDSSGITLDHGLVDMDIKSLPLGTTIAVGDEEDEVRMPDPTTVTGSWEFWRNSDGGALTSLPFPGNWSFDVRMRFIDGISDWEYVEADGNRVVLDDERVATLTAFDSPSQCRTDCRVPRCGDGFVDGGEVCDDGNSDAGDGCDADCSSLDGL
jgi:cysteine-rich repeat protein